MVSGQDGIKIQGEVTDKNDNPLIGANVIILNTSYGSSTEWNGSYSLRSHEGSCTGRCRGSHSATEYGRRLIMPAQSLIPVRMR